MIARLRTRANILQANIGEVLRIGFPGLVALHALGRHALLHITEAMSTLR